MNWDVEEKLEESLVAYFRTQLPAEIKLFTAWSADAIQYPCVIVAAHEMKPLDERLQWENIRRYTVNVDLCVPALPEKDGAGAVVKTAREINRAYRSAVVGCLAKKDLATDLQAAQVGGLAVSSATLMTGERDIDTEHRTLVTTLVLKVTAAAMELT